MRLIDELKGWFERDVHWMAWREVEAVVDQPCVAEIRFSTGRFRYVVTADVSHGESFLGGTHFDRVGRQSRDLVEGDCSERTWGRIVAEILENERGAGRTAAMKPQAERTSPTRGRSESAPLKTVHPKPASLRSEQSQAERVLEERPPPGRLF